MKMGCRDLKEIRDRMYRRMPLFFIGLAAMSGAYSVLSSAYWLTFLICGLFFLYMLRWYHFLGLCVVMIGAAFFTCMSVRIPPPDSSVSGEVVCSLTESIPCIFHKKPMVRCELCIDSLTDSSGQQVVKGVRAVLFQPFPSSLKGGETYRMRGVLRREHNFCFRLRSQGSIDLINTDQFSCVEWRRKVRNFLLKEVRTLFHDEDVIQLLGTMCFSLPCNPEVRRIVHKIGLDHVLGVSGIHFTQLAFLITLIASACRRWIYSCVTWGSMTLFFLLIGPLPAVFRAWASSTICIGQRVFGKEAYGLNSLGAGLLCLVFFDPMTLTTMSLQLSFLATAAILVWYRPIRSFLGHWLPSYSKKELLAFSFLDQMLSFVLRCGRATLSVVLSISLVMIPYQLAFMPDLPLMGFLSNLFLPIFFDIALIATFFVLCLSIILPFLGVLLGYLMEKYMQILINVVREMPSPSWSLVQDIHVPKHIAVLFIGLCVLAGAIVSVYAEYAKREYPESWMTAI